MRSFNERPAPNEPPAAGLAPVHVVKPAAERPDERHAAEPLRIDYSTTRIVPEARARLQRLNGVVRNDRSALAEAFKMLRNQVLQRMRGDGHRLLAVTSPRALAGKSLAALNLALAIAAEYDTAVLLVDADLSGQGLQRLFGLDDAPGLSDHLTKATPIPELLINPGIDRFVFLPAGVRAPLQSAELLATRAAQQLIHTMKQRYQDRYIVVDLPPMLDTADALAFLPQVDTTLLVVEEHTSAMADMDAVAELLAPFNLIGTVMSQKVVTEPALGDRPRSWWQRMLRR